jgi:outer membrane lipoprotein SlyB
MSSIRRLGRGGGCALALALTAFSASAQDLYIYPSQGQSEEQLADDRYECHSWAVRESGFDPSQWGEVAPPRTIRVPVAENPAERATEKGAVAGAVAGAIIGSRDGGAREGAVTGAIVGAIAGAAVEEQGAREARREAEEEARRQADELERTQVETALRRSNYRRALSACLEGRGYTVR